MARDCSFGEQVNAEEALTWDLMLSDRVWGYVIMRLGGLFEAGMIIVHSKEMVVRQVPRFFFVRTLFAVSTTGWSR